MRRLAFLVYLRAIELVALVVFAHFGAEWFLREPGSLGWWLPASVLFAAAVASMDTDMARRVDEDLPK